MEGGNINTNGNKNQISDLFSSAVKQTNNKKGIINLKKVGCEDEKLPIFLETVLQNFCKNAVKKVTNSKKNITKFKTNVPLLNLKSIEKPIKFSGANGVHNNDSLHLDHCKYILITQIFIYYL